MSFTPFEILTSDELSDLIPAGSGSLFFGSTAPAGWLLCDGSAVSRSNFAGLFAVMGTAYGAGDGSTTFNLPDLRQRFPLGKAAAGTGSTLGATGGAIDHTHAHSHVHDLDTPSSFAAVVTVTNAVFNARRTGVAYTDTHQLPIPAPSTIAGSAVARTIGTALGGDTDVPDAVNTGSTNPPFVTVNFIVKT